MSFNQRGCTECVDGGKELQALQARVKELENQKSKMLTAHAKVLEMHIASDKTLHDLVKGLEEEKSRLRPCRGCPTVECTCLSELEDELLDKVGDLKQENSSLRKVVDAARGAVEWHMKQPLAHYTMVELRNALNKYDELDGSTSDHGEKKCGKCEALGAIGPCDEHASPGF